MFHRRANTKLHSKDNAAARMKLSRKPTEQPRKLSKECDLVLVVGELTKQFLL
jgi:hypothetical protein